MSRLRRRFAFLLSAVVTAITAMVPATALAAASASPGGCNAHVVTRGFDIGVCISANGTHSTAYPDIWVNSRSASASDRAQGGCNDYKVVGFDFGVCVNDRGTGTTAYPDIYINTTNYPYPFSTCTVDIETWDSNNHKLGDTATGTCNTGHYTAQPVTPSGFTGSVHTFARMRLNGTSYFLGGGQGDSPSITLAANLSTCHINIETWDANNHKLGDTRVDNGCATGHYTAQAVTPDNFSGDVHTYARITWVDGSVWGTGDSPPVTLSAPSAGAGDDYPAVWKSQGTDAFRTAFGWNRECVSFVAWKIYEANGGRKAVGAQQEPSDYITYSIDVVSSWGDAWEWGGHAKGNSRLTVSNAPTPGAVAWWDKTGPFAAHGTGHVGYVSAVSRDGSGNVTGFDVPNYNLEGGDGVYWLLHFSVSNGKLTGVANHTPPGESYVLNGVTYHPDQIDVSWVPLPTGFIAGVYGGA